MGIIHVLRCLNLRARFFRYAVIQLDIVREDDFQCHHPNYIYLMLMLIDLQVLSGSAQVFNQSRALGAPSKINPFHYRYKCPY